MIKNWMGVFFCFGFGIFSANANVGPFCGNEDAARQVTADFEPVSACFERSGRTPIEAFPLVFFESRSEVMAGPRRAAWIKRVVLGDGEVGLYLEALEASGGEVSKSTELVRVQFVFQKSAHAFYQELIYGQKNVDLSGCAQSQLKFEVEGSNQDVYEVDFSRCRAYLGQVALELPEETPGRPGPGQVQLRSGLVRFVQGNPAGVKWKEPGQVYLQVRDREPVQDFAPSTF